MRPLYFSLIALIAALHCYIAWFEIFAWTSRGPAIFGTLPPEIFPQTTQLAANQGVYNAFLAAGLIWSLLIADRMWQRRIAVCFLSFVLVAGVAAAITIALRSGLFQMVPAGLALIFLAIDRRTAAAGD